MKYEVIVTRDTTESVILSVEADSEDEAQEKALELASDAEQIGGPVLSYERDECATSDPYITGCDEDEEIE